MERRYLVAALAIIATFAGLSRGFQSLQHLAAKHAWHLSEIARLKGDAAAEQALAKVRTHLRPGYPEEAQLLAEMNVPMAELQADMTRRMVKQNLAAAQCAREFGLQQAERARHDALRMREELMRSKMNLRVSPMSFEIKLPDKMDNQIATSLAISTQRPAAKYINVPIVQASATPVICAIVTSQSDSDSGSAANNGETHIRCDTDAVQRETQRAVHQAMRQYQYAFRSAQ